MTILDNKIIKELSIVLGHGADLHIVGGAVRDFLLGKEPKDLDFATKLHPQEMIARFSAAGVRFIETGIRRGTITAIIDGEPVEVTTFRNYENENTFTETIEQDLSARDFTINAIAIRVFDGKVVDPFGGIEDLKAGILRTVGEPVKRFTEDPHRIIRLARFAGKFDFIVDPHTLAGAKILTVSSMADILKSDKKPLHTIAIERVQAELAKILTIETGAGVVRAIRILDELEFFDHFIPELVKCRGVEQNKYHSFDVFEHILAVVAGTPCDLEVRLAALLHDIAKPVTITVGEDGVRHFLTHEDVGAEMAITILTRLKFPTETIEHVAKLIKEHMRDTDMGPAGVRRLMKTMGDLFPKWIALKQADKLGGRPDAITDKFQIKWTKFLERVEHEKTRKEKHPFDELAITGYDVMKAGVKQGPEVGVVLKTLMEKVLDDPEFNTRERLLEEIRGML